MENKVLDCIRKNWKDLVICWYICYGVYVSVCSVMSDSLRPYGLEPARLLCPWDFPGRNTGVCCHFLLQGIFPTQGLNIHLLCLLPWKAGPLLLCQLGSPSLMKCLEKYRHACTRMSHLRAIILCSKTVILIMRNYLVLPKRPCHCTGLMKIIQYP